MGADGHIVIYDLEAIKKDLTEDELKIVKCAMVYEHEIFGKKVLTEYFGDNIYSRADDYDDMYGYIKPDSEYYVSKEKFEDVWARIRKHRITAWEVWT